MNATAQPPDPVTLLANLSVEQLRQRLADLDAEAKAVRVLLRSALARERAAARHAPTPATPEEAPRV